MYSIVVGNRCNDNSRSTDTQPGRWYLNKHENNVPAMPAVHDIKSKI